jgi:hypothetical protein
MKQCSIILCLLISSALFGQDSVEIRIYYDGYYKAQLKTSYWALKSDTTIKNGPYVDYFMIGGLCKKGMYKNNKRVGIWEFQDKSLRKPYLIYDFDNENIVLHKQRFEESNGEAWCFTDSVQTKLDMIPIFPQFEPNSFSGFTDYIIGLVKSKLQTSLIEDYTTSITFSIDTFGCIQAHKSLEKIRNVSELDKNVIAIFNSICGWIPAEINNKKVTCDRYEIRIDLKKNEP